MGSGRSARGEPHPGREDFGGGQGGSRPVAAPGSGPWPSGTCGTEGRAVPPVARQIRVGEGLRMLPRWRRWRQDLRAGWTKVRQGSVTAVNRSLEEVELLRLKFALDAVEGQIKELYRAVGERAFQLIERETSSVMH